MDSTVINCKCILGKTIKNIIGDGDERAFAL